jgi:hypothetical protein
VQLDCYITLINTLQKCYNKIKSKYIDRVTSFYWGLELFSICNQWVKPSLARMLIPLRADSTEKKTWFYLCNFQQIAQSGHPAFLHC